MKEAAHYQRLIQGAMRQGWFLYRIADGSPGRKPFDIGGTSPCGLAVGLEVKVVDHLPREGAALPWQIFAIHQRAWLETFAKTGGVSLAGLYSKSDGVMVFYRFLSAEELDHPVEQLRTIQMDWRPQPQIYTGWDRIL